MSVPTDLAAILAGPAELDTQEQAFPFLTVDDAGFPHVALLSRAEVDVTADGKGVAAVIASTRTRANLAARGQAGLIAVEGTTAHYAKLAVVRSDEAEGLLGVLLEVVEHKADSLGIPLEPIRFRATGEVAEMEHWDRSGRLLAALGVSR